MLRVATQLANNLPLHFRMIQDTTLSFHSDAQMQHSTSDWKVERYHLTTGFHQPPALCRCSDTEVFLNIEIYGLVYPNVWNLARVFLTKRNPKHYSLLVSCKLSSFEIPFCLYFIAIFYFLLSSTTLACTSDGAAS